MTHEELREAFAAGYKVSPYSQDLEDAWQRYLRERLSAGPDSKSLSRGATTGLPADESHYTTVGKFSQLPTKDEVRHCKDCDTWILASNVDCPFCTQLAELEKNSDS